MFLCWHWYCLCYSLSSGGRRRRSFGLNGKVGRKRQKNKIVFASEICSYCRKATILPRFLQRNHTIFQERHPVLLLVTSLPFVLHFFALAVVCWLASLITEFVRHTKGTRLETKKKMTKKLLLFMMIGYATHTQLKEWSKK